MFIISKLQFQNKSYNLYNSLSYYPTIDFSVIRSKVSLPINYIYFYGQFNVAIYF